MQKALHASSYILNNLIILQSFSKKKFLKAFIFVFAPEMLFS